MRRTRWAFELINTLHYYFKQSVDELHYCFVLGPVVWLLLELNFLFLEHNLVYEQLILFRPLFDENLQDFLGVLFVFLGEEQD